MAANGIRHAGIVVLQSAPSGRRPWVDRCLASVASWCEQAGAERLFLGDELFDLVPDEWRAAAGPERLPLTDYARLLWLRRLHDEGYAHAIWLDADILMLDLSLRFPKEDFLCRELWVGSREGSRIKAIEAMNNCAMGYVAGSPLLHWYIEACVEAAARGPLSKLALGPDLLRLKHKQSPLPLTQAIPTLSPILIRAIGQGDTDLLRLFLRHWGAPIAAAHLCSSLASGSPEGASKADQILDATIDKLVAGGLAQAG